jgi:hypothetical protein
MAALREDKPFSVAALREAIEKLEPSPLIESHEYEFCRARHRTRPSRPRGLLSGRRSSGAHRASGGAPLLPAERFVIDLMGATERALAARDWHEAVRIVADAYRDQVKPLLVARPDYSVAYFGSVPIRSRSSSGTS